MKNEFNTEDLVVFSCFTRKNYMEQATTNLESQINPDNLTKDDLKKDNLTKDNLTKNSQEDAKEKARLSKENKTKDLIQEIDKLKPGDAKINFLLDNNNENWKAIMSLGYKKASEIVNLFLSKLSSQEQQPDKLTNLMRLPLTSSFLTFGFIVDQAETSQNPQFVSETLKKGFEAGGKPLPSLLLATILLERFRNRLSSEQNIELATNIMQGQAEATNLNNFLFKGLLRSLNKIILKNLDEQASAKLLSEMMTKSKDNRLDFDSFPMDDLISKIEVKQIKQFTAEQILLVSNSSMSFEQKKLILDKFFDGENAKNMSVSWTKENHRQLLRNLLKKHFTKLEEILNLKEKSENSQEKSWPNLFAGVAKLTGTGLSVRKAALGS